MFLLEQKRWNSGGFNIFQSLSCTFLNAQFRCCLSSKRSADVAQEVNLRNQLKPGADATRCRKALYQCSHRPQKD